MQVHTKIVARDIWGDLEQLFESRGGPKSCWCMVWRAIGEEKKHTDGKSRKSFLKARVDSNIPVGILAYVDNQPVGWCSVAPKTTFRKLDDLPLSRHEENIWSIVCFFIKRDYRSKHISHELLKAAIHYAKREKAAIVEAYPVDRDSPSYRFMGFTSLFEKFGFRDIGRAGKRRHVMRLDI